MKGNKMKHSRSGFTMAEMAFVLALFAVLALGLYKWSVTVSDDAMVKQEYLNAYRVESGLNTSMIAILDTFEGVCGTVTDATASMAWGWGSSSCTGTSPLPTRSGNNLVYSINFASLSAATATGLKNKISASYAPLCKMSGSTATTMTLFCGSTLNNFQYDTSGGLVNTYHTPGTNFNHLDTPVPVLTLKRVYLQGNLTETKVYRLNLQEVFQQRLAYSTEKMNNVGKLLKNLYNMKLAQETSNVSPAGLNSIDDEMIPWFWEAFGDQAGTAATTVCSKNVATGVCDNLNTNNIWRSTTSDAILWKRLIVGLAASDFKYTVDGFGNALRLYPMLSQCVGTNLAVCTVTVPSIPKEPYPISATLKPPYTTVIYSGLSSGGVNCADTSLQAPIGCRYPIVY